MSVFPAHAGRPSETQNQPACIRASDDDMRVI